MGVGPCTDYTGGTGASQTLGVHETGEDHKMALVGLSVEMEVRKSG